jgi:hypothetical protein
MDWDSIPMGNEKDDERTSRQKRLTSELARLAGDKEIDSADEPVETLNPTPRENTVSLSVYLLPDQTPFQFFSHCAGITPSVSGKDESQRRLTNTLLAFVRIN